MKEFIIKKLSGKQLFQYSYSLCQYLHKLSYRVSRAVLNTGFTLVELLIILAIIMTIGFSTIPFSTNFLTRSDLSNKTHELSLLLNTAKLNSISAKENSNWGVNILSSTFTLYKGNSFMNRDPAFDQSFGIPINITITQNDINFEKLTGNTNSVNLVLRNAINETHTVTVNQVGTIDIQ